MAPTKSFSASHQPANQQPTHRPYHCRTLTLVNMLPRLSTIWNIPSFLFTWNILPIHLKFDIQRPLLSRSRLQIIWGWSSDSLGFRAATAAGFLKTTCRLVSTTTKACRHPANDFLSCCNSNGTLESAGKWDYYH